MDLQIRSRTSDDCEASLNYNKSPKILFQSNPDILAEICEYLSYEYESELDTISSSRTTLYRLALTSKTFLEPALDHLWRVLDSLFPLLKILPAFVSSEGTYVLRGPISTDDWARFDWYARRVRKFSYSRDPGSLDIAMHVYFRLAQLRTTPLLPALRHLYCPSTSQNDFLISGICLFLSPSLQALEFDGISAMEDKLCGTVLHTLFSDGARMEQIILRGRGLSQDTLNIAIKFEYLRVLDIQGMGESLNMTALEQIGKMPWLTDLTIDFSDSSIPPLSHDIGMRDLKSLMITATVPFMLSFLPHVATTILEAFFAASPSSSVDKKDLLQEVVTKWRSTLRRVGLMRRQDEGTEELGLTVLAPLFPLKRLTYLRLEGYSMQLTDTNIESFALAWPNMDTLLLPFISAEHARPTIASLHCLARLLPKLRCLRIPLNTADLPLFVSTGIPHTPVHELDTLTIASTDDPWELRDVLHLSRHIDYFFPKIRHTYPYDGPDRDRWAQVHEMLRMYQAVRKEAIAYERARLP